MTRHGVLTISDAELDALACLADDRGTLTLLQRARTGRNMAFLAALLHDTHADFSPGSRIGRPAAGPARSHGQGSAPHPAVPAGFEILVAVQRSDPMVVRDILHHHRFGAWAAVCASETATRSPAGDPTVRAYLASFAATAAIRAGIEFDLELPQVGDMVVLPGLGCWIGPVADRVSVRYRGGTPPRPDGYRWIPLRRLTASSPFGPADVEFDDLPPTPSAWPEVVAMDSRDRRHPYDDSEFRRWQRLFGAAVPLLAAAVPELTAPLVQGMHALLPRGREPGGFLSSTLVDSFGAAAMIRPDDPVTLATGLLHEFQHSKLAVLMELRPLVAEEGPADLPSPWRREPRTAGAVLHGAYAHLAVARFLRRVAGDGNGSPIPDACSVEHDVRTGCETLLDSDRLTPSGRRFVTVMRRAVAADATGATAGPTV